MTLSPWAVYFWGIADQARAVIEGGLWIAGAALVVLCILQFVFTIESEEKLAAKAGRSIRQVLPVAAALMLAFGLIPTSNTIAVMSVAPALVNSDAIQKDLPELYDIAIEVLKDKLKGHISGAGADTGSASEK